MAMLRAMHISRDVGLPVVKAFESCLKALRDRPGYFTTYYCPAGVLTWGWGHTNLGATLPKIRDGFVGSQADCDAALENDMVAHDARVNRVLEGVALKQYQFDALSSFDFNTGGLDKSSIPAKIKAGRWSEVAPTLDRWNKANGQVLNGLVRRRRAEGLLFDGKIEEALKVAGAHRAAGGLMAQRVDRPTPPPAEVVKRAAPEIATMGAGAGTGTAGAAAKPGTVQPSTPKAPDQAHHQLAGAAVVIGLVLAFVGAVLFIRKYIKIDADWA